VSSAGNNGPTLLNVQSEKLGGWGDEVADTRPGVITLSMRCQRRSRIALDAKARHDKATINLLRPALLLDKATARYDCQLCQ